MLNWVFSFALFKLFVVLVLASEVEVNDFELPTNIEFNHEDGDKSIQVSLCCSPIRKEYKIKLTCSSKWCKEKSPIEVPLRRNNTFLSNGEFLIDLPENATFAFTEYVPQLYSAGTLLRNYSIIRTNPRNPNPVQNISVYCVSETELGLKWQHPNPPTGEMGDFIINLNQVNNSTKSSKRVINSSFYCQFWENYQCLNILNLEPNSDYYVELYGSNKDVDVLSNPTEETISTREYDSTTFSKSLNMEHLSHNDSLRFSWKTIYHSDCRPKMAKIIDYGVEKAKFTLDKSVKNYELKLGKLPRHNMSLVLQDLDNKEETIATATLIRIFLINGKSIRNLFLTNFCVNMNCTLKVPIEVQPENANSYDFLLLKTNAGNLSEEEIIEIYKDRNNSDKIIKLHKEGQHFIAKIPNFSGKNASILNGEFLIYPTNNGTGLTYQTRKLNLESFTKQGMIQNIVLYFLAILLILLACIISYFTFKLYKKSRKGLENEEKHLLPRNSEINNPGFETICAHSQPIKRENLENYLNKELKLLKDQFEKIPLYFNEKSSAEGRSLHNSIKNRYRSRVPYDDTRVILKRNAGDDYINASYIDGYMEGQVFIATQGPKSNTVNDFWWMTWQEGVTTIVMLTNLIEDEKEKCFKYWPEFQKTYNFDSIKVKYESRKDFSGWIFRKFHVKFGKEVRSVCQYHFTSWPDRDVPKHPENLLDFVKKLLNVPRPILVHCSAGCGRTGALILCHIAIQMAEKQGEVDFYKILSELRRQRMGLVSDLSQYIFSHFLVYDYLSTPKYSTPLNFNYRLKLNSFLINVRPLMQIIDKNLTLFSKIRPPLFLEISDEDKKKNRFPNAHPNGRFQVFLNSGSRYINAIKIDCRLRSFIVTQQPLPLTISDFWALVNKFQVFTVINLNYLSAESDTAVFWQPEFLLQCFNDHKITLEVLEERSSKYCNKIKIKSTEGGYSYRIVDIINVKNWGNKAPTPAKTTDLIRVWREFVSRSNECIIITCHDGCTASGLFVALNVLLDKMDSEKICDIASAVKFVKYHQPQFLKNECQVEFLCRAAQEYILSLNRKYLQK